MKSLYLHIQGLNCTPWPLPGEPEFKGLLAEVQNAMVSDRLVVQCAFPNIYLLFLLPQKADIVCLVLVTVLQTYPMAKGFCEGWPFVVIRLEILVGEMLGKEREHSICALRVRNKFSPQQKLINNDL